MDTEAPKPPTESDPAAGQLGEPSEAVDPSDPYSQFVVYEETEWVYQEEAAGKPRSSATSPNLPSQPNKVALSRRVLYLQGALLGVVAVFSLTVGMLIGARRDAENVGTGVHGPQPCLVSGRIALRTGDDSLLPDQGAVAIVLPQQSHPEDQLEIVGLRPQDPPLPDDHPTVRAIRTLGGDLARADAEGRYRLQVANRGHYYVLVISATRRRDQSELPRPILAQLGRYFRLGNDLFGGYDYRWQEETVRADRQLNFAF